MSLRIALYAEGPAEDRGEDCFLPPPGEPLFENHRGPAHHLVARAIERYLRVPAPAIRFLAPARIKAKRMLGSDLHNPRNLRKLIELAALHQANATIVLVDEDGDPQRRTDLLQGTQGTDVSRVVAVAVREFEAWLLADQRILVDVVGAVETPPRPAAMARGQAKSWLRERIEWACASGDQHARARHFRSCRIELARRVDLDLLGKQESFHTFAGDLHALHTP